MLDNIKLLQKLVEIESLSGQEKKAANFLIRHTKKLNFDKTYKDDAGNFVAERGGGNNIILLVGHVDTVSGKIPVRIKNNNLYGRGSVDAKGCLATFISAVNNLVNLENNKFIIIGAVEEECETSKGAKFILDKYNPNAIFIGEPSGWSNITIGYKGSLRLEYADECQNLHYANPDSNLINKAINFINNLKNNLSEDEILEIRNFNTTNNGLTQKVNIKINIRTSPNFNINKIDNLLKNKQITIKENIPGIIANKNNFLVKSMLKSIRKSSGKPKFLRKTGTSDFNYLAKNWPNIPILAYGPGNSKLDHAPNEHLDLNEYKKAIKVLTFALNSVKMGA
ncbi:MAG: M20/M25/M40 family metallo-hydrolase [Patescibacteria group bacterium]